MEIKLGDHFWIMIDNVPQEIYISRIDTITLHPTYRKRFGETYPKQELPNDDTIYHASRWSDSSNVGKCNSYELAQYKLYTTKEELVQSLLDVNPLFHKKLFII